MSKHGEVIHKITEEWIDTKTFREMPKSFSTYDDELIKRLEETDIEIQGVSIGRFNDDYITGTVNFVNEDDKNSVSQFTIIIKDGK